MAIGYIYSELNQYFTHYETPPAMPTTSWGESMILQFFFFQSIEEQKNSNTLFFL